ncbi:MAG: arsenite methyltransferase [Chloroflexi bacterium]|nr:arsenite methyltransferase [Chloroflexota bacterium]
MSMTQAAATYFERVAGNWDELRAGYFPEAVREAAIAKAYLRPEMVVADVGSGAGFLASALAPLVSRVYALDGSATMLDVARRNLTGFTNVTFQATDGATLPLPDASLDAVFANMYLHHCPDPAAAINEMTRVLKPGGRLVITDLDAHTHAWMAAEMADEWLGFDRGQVKAWLRGADLVNVIVDCTSQSCCATSQTDTADQAQISVFVATGSRRVTGAQEAVQASYGAAAAGQGCDCSSIAEPAGSCCGPSANAMDLIDTGAAGQPITLWMTGYTAEQVAAVPAEAAQIALGCGNPTALAALRPGEVVLDIGSGGGIDAFYAARRVGAAGRVIGLDMTPAMIERARRAAAQAGLRQVEFRLGQAEAMPVEDDTVDVILSNCVINLCEDKGRVFEEAYRVLRSGGRLAISDMVSDGPFPSSLRGDPARWAGCVHGALPEREYLDLVAAAGFTDVEAAHSLSGGGIEGVQVYSLSVSARKG